jgi:hypothetical protein
MRKVRPTSDTTRVADERQPSDGERREEMCALVGIQFGQNPTTASHLASSTLLFSALASCSPAPDPVP